MDNTEKKERLEELHSLVIAVIEEFASDPFLERMDSGMQEVAYQGLAEDNKIMQKIDAEGRALLADAFRDCSPFQAEWNSPSCMINLKDPFRLKCIEILKIYKGVLKRAIKNVDDGECQE